MSLAASIFALLLLAFAVKGPLARKFPPSPAFERLAPWLGGVLLVIFLAALLWGISEVYWR